MWRERVVKADSIDSLFGGLPSRSFSTHTSFSVPNMFSGTSSGTIMPNGLSRMQGTIGFGGAISSGSNMNRTEETTNITQSFPLEADWSVSPETMTHVPTYREWQVAIKNLCFFSYAPGSRGGADTGDRGAYTGRWDDNTFRCLSWFSLNFELLQQQNNIQNLNDFRRAYGYIGYLQTIEGGEVWTGRASNRCGAFHVTGRSRMPNIWALQEDGSGVKTHARLWLLLQVVRYTAANGRFVRHLRISPWAESSGPGSASAFPADTIDKFFVGHLEYTEGSNCPSKETMHAAFYPKSDTGDVARQSLLTMSALPVVYVTVGHGCVLASV